MHDFQPVVGRAHRNVHARQAKGGDETQTSKPAATTDADKKTAATATPDAAKTATASSAAPTTTARAVTTATAATTSSQTPLIDISSILGLTSSTISPSSTTSSHPTTTSTSSSTISSSTTSSAPTTSSTSSVARQLSTSTATLTSSNTAAAASATETGSTHSGLSGAETGAIIAGCILVGLALLIFAIRKTFIQRRKRKRNTWGAGVYPDINDKYSDGAMDLPPPIPEKAPSSNGYLEPRTPVWAPPRPVSPNPPPTSPPPLQNFYVQPPQPSYNNAIMDAVPAVTSMAPATGSFGAPAVQGEPATVRVLYIPTLPDELSITTGESVQIIKAYDDGWALCANARGEQGVVPLECLERTGTAQTNRLSVGNGQQEGSSDWRNMKRMSSLSTQ